MHNSIQINNLIETNNFGQAIIIGIEKNYNAKHSQKIQIRFINTNYIAWFSYSSTYNGNCKDLLARTVYGVGYHGVGKYNPNNSKIARKKWYSIMVRCYNGNIMANKSYIGCTVDPHWHNFQNFAKWHEENYVDGYEIDKDILFPGNRVYGPKNCVYVPRWINSTFRTKTIYDSDTFKTKQVIYKKIQKILKVLNSPECPEKIIKPVSKMLKALQNKLTTNIPIQ